MASQVNPAENVRRRKIAADHADWLAEQLRGRIPDLPLEIEVEAATLPVQNEEAHLYVRTDGVAVLRVQAIANDLVRQLAAERGVHFAARVWPRTIWCRRSGRREPREHTGPGAPATEGLLYSERDALGNTRLCLAGSHENEHDFGE